MEGKKKGNGGAACTLNVKRTFPTPPKQISGAFSKRSIPISEFGRFYDRGDLPVKVGHSERELQKGPNGKNPFQTKGKEFSSFLFFGQDATFHVMYVSKSLC